MKTLDQEKDGPVKVITGSASPIWSLSLVCFAHGQLEKGAALLTGKGRPLCGAGIQALGSGRTRREEGGVGYARLLQPPLRSCECEAGASGPTMQRSSVPSDGVVQSAPKDGLKSDWGWMQLRVPVGLMTV